MEVRVPLLTWHVLLHGKVQVLGAGLNAADMEGTFPATKKSCKLKLAVHVNLGRGWRHQGQAQLRIQFRS